MQSESRASISRCSSISKEDLSAKKLLTNMHPNKVSISFFKTNTTSRWRYPSFDLKFNENKGRTKQYIKPRSTFFHKKPQTVETTKTPQRIRQLPPPNFMKNFSILKKTLFDPRIATTSNRFRRHSQV